MNIKEIVEGMTAQQVAQVIKDNFNEVDKDKANKTDLNKSISDLASVVEANKTDLTEKIDNNKEEADEKISELGSEVESVNKFDLIRTTGSMAIDGVPFMEFQGGKVLKEDGSVVEREDFPTAYVSEFFQTNNPRDYGLVRLNKLFPVWDGISTSIKSANVVLYDSNKKFVRAVRYSETAIIVVPFGYYLRTCHYVPDNDLSNLVILDPNIVAVEDALLPMAEKVNLIEYILPFFEKTNELSAEKQVNGAFIGGGGYIVNQEAYSYIIFNVEGIEKIKIHIGKNTMWGAPIWTTYSGLNDGEIDQSLKIRNHVGTEEESKVAYDEIIELSDNEKYIVIGNSTNELIEYGYSIKNLEGYYIGNSAQEIDEELNEIENSLSQISLPITEKNIVILGDSITWQGGADCTKTKGWTYWFKERLKPKSIKSFAWSGATWSNDSNTKVNEEPPLILDSDNTIWQQVRRLINAYNDGSQVKPDIIIIAAGINDVIALNRGERNACLDKTASQAFANRTSYITDASVETVLTVADAIRYNCEILIQTFPDVQIVLATPLQASYSEVNQENWNKVVAIIKECGAYISANVIEQGKVCGIYYTQEYISNYNLSDGLHPNEIGAKKIGNIVASIVNSMI